MLKILLVDDHPLFREGLKYRLSLEPSITQIQEASSGQQALATLAKEAFDVVVMDINMPDGDGMYVLELMRERGIDAKVLMLSMHDNKEYINAAMRNGANGYILKDVAGSELIDALKQVAQGKLYFSREVSSILSSQLQEQKPEITPREQLVLRLIAKGLADKRIANELDISNRTVETHKRNIKKKLGIDSSLALVRYAIEHGLDK